MQAKRAGLPLKWLLSVSFINSFGFDFLWPLASVYIHEQLGQDMVTVGWVLFLNAILQMLGALLAGRLFDKYQPRTLFRGGTIAMIFFLALLVFWHAWPAFPILLSATGFLFGWLTALINSYGTRVYSHDGRFVFNMLYFIANFGMAFGTALVGFIYGFGVQWLFIAALVLYIIMLTVAWRFLGMEFPKVEHTENKAYKHSSMMPVWNLIIIYTLVMALVVLHTAYVQWQGNLSVYMSSVLSLPLWQYSLLWTINGVLIGVFQLIINMLNVSANRKTMIAQILFGLGLFGLAFLVLPFAKTFAVFAIAMAITTLGETIAFPMVPVLVNEITPMDLKGRYQGVLSAAPSLGRAIGPVAGGALIEMAGYQVLFDTAAVMSFVALAGVLIMMLIGFRKTAKF